MPAHETGHHVQVEPRCSPGALRRALPESPPAKRTRPRFNFYDHTLKASLACYHKLRGNGMGGLCPRRNVRQCRWQEKRTAREEIKKQIVYQGSTGLTHVLYWM